MRYIGVDLHKDNFVVCYLYRTSKSKRFETYSLTEISSFCQKLKSSDLLGVEATTHSQFFMKQVENFVSEVKIINTFQFKVISTSIKKTDKNDAETIAFYLKKDLLPEVRKKDSKLNELESLVNTRDKLVKLRSSLKNKIHNSLLSQGILSKREQFSSEKSLKKVLEYDVSPIAKIELEILVDQIRSLNKSIKQIDNNLIEEGKKLKGFDSLTSIKGIGERSATILLSVIGDIDDFSSAKKLFSYFGVVPKNRNSNKSNPNCKISKRGSKVARTALVQCALIAKRYSPYLKTFYDRVKANTNSGKAIIATSKKLLGIIYNSLKNEWVFEDFPNFVIKT